MAGMRPKSARSVNSVQSVQSVQLINSFKIYYAFPIRYIKSFRRPPMRARYSSVTMASLWRRVHWVNQYGVFAWIDIEQNTSLTTYAGRIWPSNQELERYFAFDPEIALKKQRYLFDLGESLVSDPTDIFGNLFNVQASGNVAPYFNEPPYGIHANCFVEAEKIQENKTKGGRKSPPNSANAYRPLITLHISTCVLVNAFRELFILYENEAEIHNGLGKYELRDYLVGRPCIGLNTNGLGVSGINQTPLQDAKIQKQLLEQVQSEYKVSVNNELERIDALKQSNDYKNSIWMRPIVVCEMDKPDRCVCMWPDIDVVKQNASDVIELRAARPIAKRVRLPIFGIPLTEEGFDTKAQFYPDARPFMIQGRVGYLFADPQYRTYNFCGGDGSFIWVYLKPVKRSMLANMELHSDGDYFEAMRDIALGEVLTYYSI